MSCLIQSATLRGYHAEEVQVEVDLLRRLPSVSIVGMAGGAVRESADRVRSAILESKGIFPKLRVVINLAPAGLRKEGAAFDLPIAIGILLKSGQVNHPDIWNSLFIGELSLSGALRPIKGALSIALLAKSIGCKHLILPKENAQEASVATGLTVYGFNSLEEVMAWLKGMHSPIPAKSCASKPEHRTDIDMSEVKGQAHAKRGLEIAAAGCHNLLMTGPPGCGKTMMAMRLPSILPTLNEAEAIDITRIHSAIGENRKGGLIWSRPFRAPHHSISMAGMIGNKSLRPGEASLAHNGVLFLDELSEYRRDVLESLRSPLESGWVTLHRSAGAIRFPARFSLIAAANPCPCGFDGHPTMPCQCGERQKLNYRAKISGPILDRMDLQLSLQPTPASEITDKRPSESSFLIQARVEKARQIQRHRYQREEIHNNAQLQGKAIEDHCPLSQKAQQTLIELIERYDISGRGWARLIKLSRTIADLDESDLIQIDHLYEAAAFRLGNLP